MAYAHYPYDGKCVCIITGGSRGFGRAISQLICDNENGILGAAADGSKIILMSRNETELEKTKSLIMENKTSNFEIDVVPVDLSNLKSTQDIIIKTFERCDKNVKHAFLFNNAGALGNPEKKISDYDNIDEIENTFNINVISSVFLMSRFCKYFEESSRFVIQISSLAALKPFPYTGLYTSSKACMDMLVRNLVVDCPEVRALNYAPGPMDTDMARELKNKSGSEDTRNAFTAMFTEGTIINPVDSVKKLMSLLRKNEFDNASHIDFYDV